jgi:DNA-binding MarR family transcriptional regulator
LKDMEGGPFTQLFGGPVARVLDQARIVGNMEQTIPILAESTGLTFKTVQKAIAKLIKYGFVKRSRKISNAQTYRFDVEHDLHELLAWADRVNLKQMRR